MRLKMTIKLTQAVALVMAMFMQMGSAIDMGQYQGCYNTSNSRWLLTKLGETSSVDDCARACREVLSSSTRLSYRMAPEPFAGIEAGTKCWCSNSIVSSALASLNCYTETAMRCSGDNSTICGAADAMSVYRVCPIGKQGMNCDIDCDSDCGNQGCDVIGLQCTSYCDAGFYSTDQYLKDNCPYPCPLDRYGPSCRFNCPDGCNNTACDNRDGRCIDGCTDTSKRGPYCTDTCVPGKHGQNCDQDCPPECRYACNSATGACDQCVEGKYGTDCNTDCPSGCAGACDKSTGYCDICVNGMYGPYCQYTCSSSCKSGTCTKSDGSCSPCKPNWTGDKCERCVEGKYGSDCELECSDGCQGTCDKVSGSCMCKQGWYGQRCDSECEGNCLNGCDQSTAECNGCVDGKQGRKCDVNCSSSCVALKCEQFRGGCSSGCEDGFHGVSCEETCPDNCLDNKCEQIGGICQQCIPGKQGDKCDAECDSLAFGPGCISTCHCADDVSCDPESGACPGGVCAPGFQGTNCNALVAQTIEKQEAPWVIIVAVLGSLLALATIIIVTIVVVYFRRKNAQTNSTPDDLPYENQNIAGAQNPCESHEVHPDLQPKPQGPLYSNHPVPASSYNNALNHEYENQHTINPRSGQDISEYEDVEGVNHRPGQDFSEYEDPDGLLSQYDEINMADISPTTNTYEEIRH